MKKLILVLLLLLTACSQHGNIDNVSISDWRPSDIYTDKDIEEAMTCVKIYFKENFSGCTLMTMSYVGDSYEAIVISSSFITDESGGDGPLNPNDIYEDFQWILVRNENNEWEHVDHGY